MTKIDDKGNGTYAHSGACQLFALVSLFSETIRKEFYSSLKLPIISS